MLVIAYALITIMPLVWIIADRVQVAVRRHRLSAEGGVRADAGGLCQPVHHPHPGHARDARGTAAAGQPGTTAIVRDYGMVIAGRSRYGERFLNSVIIGFGSTFLSIVLGTLAAYAFSRFKVPLKDDLMFFILSTRMMPPIAVAIPIFLMYRQLGLSDTHLGMILLYTAVNSVAGGLAAEGLHRRNPASNTRRRR